MPYVRVLKNINTPPRFRGDISLNDPDENMYFSRDGVNWKMLLDKDNNYYRGKFTDEATLLATLTSGKYGDYAVVQPEAAAPLSVYFWSNLDSTWLQISGGGSGNYKSKTLDYRIKSQDYTCVADDEYIIHPSSDNSHRVFRIPANSSVPYNIGHVLTFSNSSAAPLTIDIISDTMKVGGSSSTAPVQLMQNGLASAVKESATNWLITGVGMTLGQGRSALLQENGSLLLAEDGSNIILG